MQSYLIKLVGTLFTMTVEADSPEEAVARHFPSVAKDPAGPACRFEISLGNRQLGILVLPLINDDRIEELIEASMTLLNTDEIRLNIALEEITPEELSDTAYMVDRIEVWEES